MTAADAARLAESRMNGTDAPSLSEDALALEYAERYEAAYRYVAAWGHWYRYDGSCWRKDATLEAFDRARVICREAAAGKAANRKLASAKTVAAVVQLARADRRMAATTDQWDSDPWLLNTPESTVDLRTGKQHPHFAAHYITKQTAITPSGQCPLWLDFLDRVTAGNDDEQDFLQRVAGYALTGSTRDHAMFFVHGSGANGKSVFLNTLAGIAGDYSRSAPMETFTASSSDRHPTELAMLRGARLVTAVETEEGRRWAESRIKALTGGDPIAARFMRQDFFEYVPQFKLLIAGNHKPSLRAVDEAIRRRLHLIPFTVTIPEDERDEDLPEKLKAEWPGIIQWMVDGARQWFDQGLSPPQTVKDATAAYLDNEDAMAQWMDECCTTDPNLTGKVGDLFKSWSDWATAANEHVGTKRGFGDNLETRGYPRAKDTSGNSRVHQGIGTTPKYDGDNRYR